MDRFEIALHFKNQRKKRRAFHFPATKYAGQAVKYLEYSIVNEGIFVADNVPSRALDSAVIRISQIYEAAVVIESESKALLFSIAHSHKVFSLENLPINKYIICYNCSDNLIPLDYQVIGTVYGHTKDLVFI